MLEKEVESYLRWAVERKGGKSYKFTSPSHRGAADRVIILPKGKVFFIEVKTVGGKLSELQKKFGAEVTQLNANYEVLWSKEQIDDFIKRNAE